MRSWVAAMRFSKISPPSAAWVRPVLDGLVDVEDVQQAVEALLELLEQEHHLLHLLPGDVLELEGVEDLEGLVGNGPQGRHARLQVHGRGRRGQRLGEQEFQDLLGQLGGIGALPGAGEEVVHLASGRRPGRPGIPAWPWRRP